MNDNYCGDGGVPGYIMGWLVPNEDTLKRLPVALAHETNHNVRFQFEKWHDDITLAEMMVSEGLAENFAAYLYGEENLGPWVAKTDLETLNTKIKPIIKEGLSAQGLENITAYLYGDEMAKHGFCSQLVLQNGMPIAILEYMLQSSGSVYLSLLMLLKDSQNKGLGTDIYRFFEQNMISIGASEIRIDVVNDYHPNVVPFWERMGFVGQNEDTLTWGQKTSRVLVMKKLL